MTDQPIGQVDALRVPRFAGVRTFARLPTLEQAGRADVASLSSGRGRNMSAEGKVVGGR